ncbi:MAG: response regulator transcription factor [Candidatus Cyclobacteriaceae bacterium M3_2C_046]
MEKFKILIVEDDPNLGQILREYLQLKGFEATLCADGEIGLSCFNEQTFDICLLDIMLPKKDGFSLAKDIRTNNPDIPFIFLTAKSLKEDTIQGLKLGADDYITKPFSMEELLLRIHGILKRTYRNSDTASSVFNFGRFRFDFAKQELHLGQQVNRLTTKEAELLKLLCLNMNKTLPRSLALKMIWQDDSYFNARSMDVYITKLRKYLKQDEKIRILTMHGQGFKLVAPAVKMNKSGGL